MTTGLRTPLSTPFNIATGYTCNPEMDICKLLDSEVVYLGHQECFYKSHYFTVTEKKGQITKFVILLLIIQGTLLNENI